jgi:hypothetical protein
MRRVGSANVDLLPVLLGCLIAFDRTSWRAAILAPFIQPRKSMVGCCFRFRSCIVGKKLYCGNLSYNVTSADLEQLFGQFGSVKSAEVINDRDTGRSKGFGFVEMGSDQEAQAAIDGVNGTEHDGRTLTVNEARPKTERSGGGGGGRGGYGGGRGGGGGGKRW